jgi:hypothetical protein
MWEFWGKGERQLQEGTNEIVPIIKVAYIRGVRDGYLVLLESLRAYDDGGEQQEKQKAYSEAFRRLLVPGPTDSEIVRVIDDFYEDAANAQIPVVCAYFWAGEKIGGATKEQLDKSAAHNRARYNNPSLPAITPPVETE